MNLNEYVLNRGKGRGKRTTRGKSNRVLGAKSTMGPPIKPPPRKKESSTTHTTTSSELNWGKGHISVSVTPSLHKTTSSSKSSTESESRVVVAITEGRGEARCEVGIAAINVSRPHLILCQISDSQSYINTLTKINIFNPSEIIMPQTFVENLAAESRLIDIIRRQFPRVKYTSVARSIFNKTNGIEILRQLCIESSSPILLALQHRYYALSAASALLTYAQENLYIYYANSTVKIDYQESEGYAIIDVSTADRLELVCSTKPAQANKYSSLFGVLNNCLTKIGSRSLRSIILQPLCFVEKIEERLECVSELYLHPQTLISVQAILQKIPNIDMLLTLATIIPTDHQRCSTRQLNYVLLLNSLIDLITPLKEVLRNCRQPFFKGFHELLEGDEFSLIKENLRKVIQEDAYPAKGSLANIQRIFAIKAGVNGLLDLVRKTYSERIEDMREYVKKLGEKYDLPLTLGNNNTKGFHIVLNLNHQQKRFMKKSDLPEEFIQVCRLAGSFTMKTPELINLSTRIDDVMEDIFKISNVMIHSIIIEVKEYMGLFYKLCEYIAQLDVLQSLAETSRQNNYVRPKFGEYTELKQCYHPILDHLCSTPITSNPIAAGSEFNVHVVTGPNGSGKSVYIRQVALVQVMAQIGCFVPATTAIIRPADRIYARVYLEDDMEADASAFVLEIKELKYIMTTMTDKSLILMDEPCRSTSLEEGTALALAICEKLALTSAFLYITTHFTLLTKLYDMYLNVKVWQMETLVTGDNPKTMKLDYKYNVLPGVTSVKMYGVHLVRNIWPDGILRYVYQALGTFTTPRDPKVVAQEERLRLKYNYEYEFRKLKGQKKLTISEINRYLDEYQQKLQQLGISIDQMTTNENDFLPQIYHQALEDSRINSKSQEILNNSQDQFQENLCEEYFSEKQQEEFAATSKTHNMIDQRINEIFTPENSQQIMERYSANSSYNRMSEFLNEDSRNEEKLIPEINLDYSDNSNESESNFQGNAFGLFGVDHRSSRSDVSLQMSELVRQRLVEKNMSNRSQAYCMENDILYENNILSGSDVSKQMSEIVRQKLSEEMAAKHQFKSNVLSPKQNFHIEKDFANPTFTNMKPLAEFTDNIFTPRDVQLQTESNINFQISSNNNESGKLRSTENQSSSDTTRKSSWLDLPGDMDDFKFSLPLCYDSAKTSTPVVKLLGKNQFSATSKAIILSNTSDLDIESIQNELEECSKLLEEDDTFDEEDESANETLTEHQNYDIPKSLPADENEIINATPQDNYLPSKVSNDKILSPTEDTAYFTQTNLPKLLSTSPQNKDIYSNQIQQPEEETTFKRKSQYSHYISPKVSIIEGLNNKTLSFGAEDKPYFAEEPCPSRDEAENKDPEKDARVQNEKSAVEEETLSYSPLVSPSSKNDEQTSKGTEEKNFVPKSPKNIIEEQDVDMQSHLEHSFSRMQLQDKNMNKNSSSLAVNKSSTNCQESNESKSLERSASQLESSKNDNYATADERNQRDSSPNASFKSCESNGLERLKQDQNTTSGISSASRKRNLDHVTSSSSLSSASKKRSIDQVSGSQEDEATGNGAKSEDVSEPQDSKREDSTNSQKESSDSQPKKKRRLGYRLRSSAKDNLPDQKQLFLAPKKLTVREINQEFLEQDRKFLDSSSGESGMSKYLDMIKKRPTAHQVKATTHLATIRKTAAGLEVIPAKNKKRKQKDVKQMHRKFSEETIDVSIFSDKNSKPFEEFLKSGDKDYKTFSFNFAKNQEKTRDQAPDFELFQEKSACEESYDGVKTFTTNFIRTKSIDIFRNEENDGAKKNDDTLTPDGFYKENRDEINEIVKKFINPTGVSSKKNN